MADYEVGYGKPPKRTRFKKGVCPNPKGRGKRPKMALEEVIDKVLSAPVEYQERGRLRRRARIAVLIRQLASSALKADADAAASLLKLRTDAVKHAGAAANIIYVYNALPLHRRWKPPGGGR